MSLNVTFTNNQVYGIMDKNTSVWNGLVGLLAYTKVDIALAMVSYYSSRHQVIDFTLPLLYNSETLIYFKVPDETNIHHDIYSSVIYFYSIVNLKIKIKYLNMLFYFFRFLIHMLGLQLHQSF